MTASILALMLAVASVTSSSTTPDPELWTIAEGSGVVVSGSKQPASLQHTGGGTAAHLTESMRAPVCQWEQIGTGLPIPCPTDPTPALVDCPPEDTRPSLWRRARATEAAAWGAWTLVGPPVCATRATVTPEMVLTELRRLPLTPSGLVVEPDRGWVLLNLPTAVHADGAPQTLTTTVLGIGVTITATPGTYAWDFGDGATLTTTDPGKPWPAATISHAYTHPGEYRITLATTWQAVYRLDGDPTVRDVPGTATTTSSSAPFTAEERRAHLVAATCADDHTAPGC